MWGILLSEFVSLVVFVLRGFIAIGAVAATIFLVFIAVDNALFRRRERQYFSSGGAAPPRRRRN